MLRSLAFLSLAALGTGACLKPPPPGAGSGERGGKTVVLGKRAGAGTPAPAMPGVNVPAIKVNTVGWERGWKKVAVLNVDPGAGGVDIVDATGGKVAHRVPAAKVTARGVDAASQDPVWLADFTALDAPGTYRVRAGGAESDPFTIGAGAYDRALVAGAKSFYFQRTRTALVEPYALWEGDRYTRARPSHVHDDVGWDLLDHPAKKRKWKVVAGWHDAGNYDMYVPSTAPSAHALLLAYAWAPARWSDGQLDIPESRNGVPDLLDEARWGLDWVLSMQEPSGAFRHREAVMEYSPEVPADQDTTTRWIAGPSSSATAKAVAVLARASRTYKKYDPDYARRCERAARAGWAWLVDHPEHLRADGKGSPQPLWDDEPGNTDVGARFLAAAEMWRTFRDPGALAAVRELMRRPEAGADEAVKGAWANLSRWALGILAFDDETPAAVRDEARTRLLAAAEGLRQIAAADGYLCVHAPADYYWASASNLMEKTHILAMAERLAPGHGYGELAREQLHWVLGRNPNGYSMVTRVGKGPTRLYHMEWGTHEPPPPGFLLGGPNGADAGFLAPGAPAKALLWDNPAPLRSGAPAHAMWHWQQSDLWDGGFLAEEDWSAGWWTVAEPDIYYSANFVLATVSVL
jgi:endoglucanase